MAICSFKVRGPANVLVGVPASASLHGLSRWQLQEPGRTIFANEVSWKVCFWTAGAEQEASKTSKLCADLKLSSNWHQHPQRTRLDSASSGLGHASKPPGRMLLANMPEPWSVSDCGSSGHSGSTMAESETCAQERSTSGRSLEDELSAELGELLRLCDQDAREQRMMRAKLGRTQPAQHQQQCQYSLPSPPAVRLLHCMPPCASEERRRQPRPKRKPLTSPTVRRSLTASFDAVADLPARMSMLPALHAYQPYGTPGNASERSHSSHCMRTSSETAATMTQWSGEAESLVSRLAASAAAALAGMHVCGRVHGSICRHVMHMLAAEQQPSSIPAHVPHRMDSR